MTKRRNHSRSAAVGKFCARNAITPWIAWSRDWDGQVPILAAATLINRLGMMAIPFLDFNKKGNGYYTINERKFAYLTFQFGFLVMWVTLIVMGTFLRGPNWNFFGLYETWDAHKVEALDKYTVSLRESQVPPTALLQQFGRARLPAAVTCQRCSFSSTVMLAFARRRSSKLPLGFQGLLGDVLEGEGITLQHPPLALSAEPW